MSSARLPMGTFVESKMFLLYFIVIVLLEQRVVKSKPNKMYLYLGYKKDKLSKGPVSSEFSF